MALYELDGTSPTLEGDNWIAPGAHVIGNVHLGGDCGVWFGAVLRGDNEPITVGRGTNLQEHAMVHTDPGHPATIGKGCTIGHRAIIHGCTLGDNVLIGMGAIILNGARIGDNCLVGAGALVTEGKEFPAGSLIIGSPAKAVRDLSGEAMEALRESARSYQGNWKRFETGLRRLD